ncbi:hypothetical protein DFP72DRAFT_897314 [Ephemerocybe angulata]|uniref:Uncharacterized protein n=1 Tax=Ephemerocybe angulata TaxID=980116 RepID=A0A8H6HZG9_9AGAR|nr:hypothetical protein DFP72DRAFT_897314 [Tulosesus angulatus]
MAETGFPFLFLRTLRSSGRFILPFLRFVFSLGAWGLDGMVAPFALCSMRPLCGRGVVSILKRHRTDGRTRVLYSLCPMVQVSACSASSGGVPL